ncbi:MGMT family protein [Slackia exigua]|uniref:MGMT family protein n=1 Tax=Slackia exigua TaxID=84109 RepID=UPI0023F2F0F9|nr:MGMT family protein [Slackia exigua]
MGAFSDKAFDIVRRIPRGRVMSYGAVARAIGEPRKSRFVGYAMRNNPDPDIFPCHRVVFKDGAICDSYVFGGPEVQKRLLEQEGVPFLDDTHVDMAKCAWTPGEDTFGRPTDIDWEREIGD